MTDNTQLVNETTVHPVHPGLHDVYAPIASAPAEQNQQQVIEPEEPVVEAIAQQEVQQETDQQKSFRLMRHKQDILEQEKRKIQEERDQYAYELRKYKHSLDQQKAVPEKNIAPDEYVERNYVDQRIQHLEKQLIFSSLRSKYSDFDSVVSPSNIALLEREDPEFASALASSGDVYNVAAATYKAIKKLGIAGYDSQYDNMKKIEQNASKPRATSNMISSQKTESPLSRAHAFSDGLTDDMKKSYYADMKKNQRHSYQ